MRELNRPVMPLRATALLALAATAVVVDASFTVHPQQVLRSGADRWMGINLNYIRDADANRPAGAATLAEALSGLGARHLRYPGGEKSDYHRFAPPPYDRPAPVSMGWYETVAGQRMDFDAYITTCRACAAEPYVVVACDSPELTGATWDEQLDHAVAWVRYAKGRSCGVRRWEIGNENWHNGTAAPEVMAAQVARFAAAMRAADPGILIGASGNNADWWERFLPGAAGSLDFLTVSVYGCWGWGSYDRLLRPPEPDLLDAAGAALAAIDRLPGAADRERLRVVVAETNSVDYSDGGWPRTNDLGHAIATFESFGRMLREPRISAALLWSTRWMDDAEAPGDQFYALDGRNRPLPSGIAVALWGRHLADQLVAIDGGAGDLRGHASADARGIAVWLVNRGGLAAERVAVSFGREGLRACTVQRFSGTGPSDARPALSAEEPLPIADGACAVTCPPWSITVLTAR